MHSPGDSPHSTHGILTPQQGLERFHLLRFEVDSRLADHVSGLWSVSWDLGDQGYEQEILPFPRVNIGFERGEARVVGPSAERFVARLSGSGSVLGVRFEPAGFAAFSDRPMSAWVGAQVAVTDVFGAEGEALFQELGGLCGEFLEPRVPAARLEQARRSVEGFLVERLQRHEVETPRLVNALVERAQRDRRLLRAEQLAEVANCSLRSLQRLFERFVGVGPKWVLCRARAQEAAERISSGEEVDWVKLALDLGYHDQAHFIRDFKAQIGFTPTAYAARCRAR
ncbi:MAG: helix-turn-helix domain-containing protein [Polyangiaceae bacterium]